MKNELTLKRNVLKFRTHHTREMNDNLNELAAAAGEEIRTVERLTNEKVSSTDIFVNESGALEHAQELFLHFSADFESISNEYWSKMNNEESFVTDCYNKLRYAVRTYDIDKGDFLSRLRPIIKRVTGDHTTRRGDRRKCLVSHCFLIESADRKGGNVDDHYAVEESKSMQDEVIETTRERELVEKYGKDERSTAIMEIIMSDKGYIKQTDIARQLADKLSISFDSARSSVRTFIKNMKEDMTTNERFCA
ncbi:hypothetical protein P9Z84_29565 [Bacillus cereus]|uniref:hypothetical protein n=1 Tax=Bacillus thuringiensis TaxID=1428 RepID=UPI000BEB714E|nr:hypothetical protein [Bacillus thuringiensis]MEC3196800.1 hypothetical protein [Bacillus cereus]PEE69397.1 hypothetical protein COM73_19115 [Bacillus thuringiensis]PET15075.1 hypothetical protein CN517_26250 [Bacillus thuringiensis]PEV88426.1 hypothetical protein CN442_20735 [Bacillus thuringiensis]PFK91018.1 hypothetical protein COJ04_21730 [Bacillus thuringiensis]